MMEEKHKWLLELDVRVWPETE